MKKTMQLAGVLLLLSLTVFAQLPSTSLVAYFPFNGNANDESGNGNNSTYTGTGVTLTTDRFGVADKAYHFDGNAGSYIRIPSDNFPTTDRTISFWFNADNLDNGPTPFSYGGNGCYNQVLIIFNKGDSPNAYTVIAHCGTNFISAPYSVAPLNGWYQFILTISGSLQKIYINGELQQSADNFVPSTYVTDRSAIIGALLNTDGSSIYVDATAGYFKGKLDDFVIYNEAMTDAEVTTFYNESIITDIPEDTYNQRIVMSPNPTTGSTRIDLGAEYQNVKILIQDVAGRLVRSKEYKSGQVFTITPDEPSGIYFVTVISDHKRATLKLVKK
jgi:trimeric autotransporter adhesin